MFAYTDLTDSDSDTIPSLMEVLNMLHITYALPPPVGLGSFSQMAYRISRLCKYGARGANL